MMQAATKHLWQFEEMIRTAESLPAGYIQLPNKALILKWFYMSFHSEDCAKYVESGQSLSDKMLESVAEYFKNIFNLKVVDGSLAKKSKHQIKHPVRREMCHVLRKQYNKNVCHITEQRQGGDGRHSRQSNRYHCHNYKWQDCNHSSHCHNYDKHKKKQEDKTPSDCGDKAFKPCSMHGPKSKHTSKECYKNPKNKNKHQIHNKKHQYEVHHNDTHYTSDDNESRASVDMLVPSEYPASASSKGKNHEDKNYEGR